MSTTMSEPDAQAEREEIKTLLEKYQQSVNDADTTLAAAIWSHSEEVSFIHPRGHEHGWEEVKRNFYEETMGAPFSERQLSIRDARIHAYKDAAWAEFYWDFVAKIRSDGTSLTTQGRESQIYRKTDRGWVIVHVHYSGMPVTGEREGF